MAEQNGLCFHANSMLVKIEMHNCFKMSDVCRNLSRCLPDFEILNRGLLYPSVQIDEQQKQHLVSLFKKEFSSDGLFLDLTLVIKP